MTTTTHSQNSVTSTNKSTPKVGLIGLGAMGNGMAQSLRRAGHSPYVFDIRADVSAAFAKDGGTACKSLTELGGSCDVIVSVVVNAAQTESVLFGDNAGNSHTCCVAGLCRDHAIFRRVAARGAVKRGIRL